MMTADIAKFRLSAQQIASYSFSKPGDVVAWLGAMQAQDYAGTKWAIGLRLPNSTNADIEQAIAAGDIIRTWPMRHTLHFVAPADIRWMLALLAPRVIVAAAGRRRNLEIDDHTLSRSRELITSALQGGKTLTRHELYEVLENGHVSTAGQRGIHIFSYFSLQGLLCFGQHNFKQPTFVLLDEWVPSTKPIEHDEALAKLATRYFTSHGPAQLQDFVWWSGLKITDARTAIELSSSNLSKITVEDKIYWTAKDLPLDLPTIPTAYLLPGFDEYMLGYKDRTAALPLEHNQKINPGANGMFAGTIVFDGRVIGTWRRTIKKANIHISLQPFKPFNRSQLNAISDAADLYGKFMNSPTIILN